MNAKNEEAMILSAVKKLLKDTHFVALLIAVAATLVVTYFKGANGQLANLENLFTTLTKILASFFGLTLSAQTILPQALSWSGSLRDGLLQLFEEAVTTLLEQQAAKANVTVTTGSSTTGTSGNVTTTTVTTAPNPVTPQTTVSLTTPPGVVVTGSPTTPTNPAGLSNSGVG